MTTINGQGQQHSESLDLNHHTSLNQFSKVTNSPKQPFLKFSVSAILSKAKAEIHAENHIQNHPEAVKSSDHNNEGKIWLYNILNQGHNQLGKKDL